VPDQAVFILPATGSIVSMCVPLHNWTFVRVGVSRVAGVIGENVPFGRLLSISHPPAKAESMGTSVTKLGVYQR
jgi:hypothetical protein